MTRTSANRHPRPELQRDVQRLLGQCLLRIQQYEVLLKAMLVDHEVSGAVGTLEAARDARADKLSDKSLGTLVKTLFETYVVPKGFERELLPDDKTKTDQVAVALSFRIEMPPEHRSRTKAALEELVDLRNQVVHHLIERFDLRSEEGCVDAVRHLEESYGRIDRHFLELAEWAKTMDEARTRAAEFTRSPEFRDMVVNGVAPDGTFDWQHTGIVRALRESTNELAVNDWTRLDLARDWLANRHPEQVPEKYGCRTWPQVLNDSRVFALEYRAEGSGRKVPWFRERIRRLSTP